MSGLSGFDVLRQVRTRARRRCTTGGWRQASRTKPGCRRLHREVRDTPAEVVLRVCAVLRRSQNVVSSVDALLDYGHLIIDVRAHEVRVDGALVARTAREFELLEYLVGHPRQVFTRDQLFARFWGEVGDRHTLTVHTSAPGEERGGPLECCPHRDAVGRWRSVRRRTTPMGAVAKRWVLPIRTWFAIAAAIVLFGVGALAGYLVASSEEDDAGDRAGRVPAQPRENVRCSCSRSFATASRRRRRSTSRSVSPRRLVFALCGLTGTS